MKFTCVLMPWLVPLIFPMKTWGELYTKCKYFRKSICAILCLKVLLPQFLLYISKIMNTFVLNYVHPLERIKPPPLFFLKRPYTSSGFNTQHTTESLREFCIVNDIKSTRWPDDWKCEMPLYTCSTSEWRKMYIHVRHYKFIFVHVNISG